MKILLVTLMLLGIITACAPHASPPMPATTASCEELLPLRHAAREATRAGQVWTPEQEAIGRAWQAQCNTPAWASRLAWMAPKDCTGDCGAGRPPYVTDYPSPPVTYAPLAPTYRPASSRWHRH